MGIHIFFILNNHNSIVIQNRCEYNTTMVKIQNIELLFKNKYTELYKEVTSAVKF